MSPRQLLTNSIHRDKQNPTICGSNTIQRPTHTTTSHTHTHKENEPAATE